MLDRQRLILQLDKVSDSLFSRFAKEQDIARAVWKKIEKDETLSEKIKSKKFSLLVPSWSGVIGSVVKIDRWNDDYTVCAVDGSQIYYDKHQGPPCYLLNIGTVVLQYTTPQSSAQLLTDPYLCIGSDKENISLSTEHIDLKREQLEFQAAWNKSIELKKDKINKNLITFFDGSLIFFHIDINKGDDKLHYLHSYFDYLQKFCDQEIPIVGYMSYPRTKELVNIIKLELAQFDDANIEHSVVLDRLTDMDVASFFLQAGERSIIFKSKAPITYLYPKEVKPYFCYLNVGFEIVRLEFPAWMIDNELLVNNICQMAYDQALKGRGYPVCLFEAHEQAVVKAVDRDFFYIMIQRLSEKKGYQYSKSYKSMKKQYVPV